MARERVRTTIKAANATRRRWSVPPVQSSVTLGSGNARFAVTQKAASAAGNDLRIRVVVAGASTALSVSVSTNDITVNSATNAGSAATSTAAQIRDAINAHGPAAALVTAALPAGSDGTGVTGAVGFTNLAGGRDAS